MGRLWSIAVVLVLLAGCGGERGRMDKNSEDHGKGSTIPEQIAVAMRVLKQYENWADRVEWEVLKNEDGWTVIAWRIEHPERKGADRYLPWGYSVIELDRRLVAIHYTRKG